MNCWDYKRCGCRDSCPAYPSNGRRCALVIGTLCNDEKQNNFNDKLYHCLKCDFFRSEHHVRFIDQQVAEEPPFAGVPAQGGQGKY